LYLLAIGFDLHSNVLVVPQQAFIVFNSDILNRNSSWFSGPARQLMAEQPMRYLASGQSQNPDDTRAAKG